MKSDGIQSKLFHDHIIALRNVTLVLLIFDTKIK